MDKRGLVHIGATSLRTADGNLSSKLAERALSILESRVSILPSEVEISIDNGNIYAIVEDALEVADNEYLPQSLTIHEFDRMGIWKSSQTKPLPETVAKAIFADNNGFGPGRAHYQISNGLLLAVFGTDGTDGQGAPTWIVPLVQSDEPVAEPQSSILLRPQTSRSEHFYNDLTQEYVLGIDDKYIYAIRPFSDLPNSQSRESVNLHVLSKIPIRSLPEGEPIDAGVLAAHKEITVQVSLPHPSTIGEDLMNEGYWWIRYSSDLTASDGAVWLVDDQGAHVQRITFDGLGDRARASLWRCQLPNPSDLLETHIGPAALGWHYWINSATTPHELDDLRGSVLDEIQKGGMNQFWYRYGYIDSSPYYWATRGKFFAVVVYEIFNMDHSKWRLVNEYLGSPFDHFPRMFLALFKIANDGMEVLRVFRVEEFGEPIWLYILGMSDDFLYCSARTRGSNGKESLWAVNLHNFAISQLQPLEVPK